MHLTQGTQQTCLYTAVPVGSGQTAAVTSHGMVTMLRSAHFTSQPHAEWAATARWGARLPPSQGDSRWGSGESWAPPPASAAKLRVPWGRSRACFKGPPNSAEGHDFIWPECNLCSRTLSKAIEQSASDPWRMTAEHDTNPGRSTPVHQRDEERGSQQNHGRLWSTGSCMCSRLVGTFGKNQRGNFNYWSLAEHGVNSRGPWSVTAP
jgi:hypothetical protein